MLLWDGKKTHCAKAGAQLSFFRWKKMQSTARA
jgi:hypothetical protein